MNFDVTDEWLMQHLPTVQLKGEKPIPMGWLTRKDAFDFVRNVLRAIEENTTEIGQVETDNNYGHPWKRIQYKFAQDLADTPVGTPVFRIKELK